MVSADIRGGNGVEIDIVSVPAETGKKTIRVAIRMRAGSFLNGGTSAVD
jgi:hypothetical protein